MSTRSLMRFFSLFGFIFIGLLGVFRIRPANSLDQPDVLATVGEANAFEEGDGRRILGIGIGYNHPDAVSFPYLLQFSIEADAQIGPLESVIDAYPAQISVFLPGGAFLLARGAYSETDNLPFPLGL